MLTYGAAEAKYCRRSGCSSATSEKRGEENERGVLGEQRHAAQEARAHAEADAARLQRPEKEICGPRPRADQRSIDVEFEGPEGKRRRQHLKQDRCQASERAEEYAGKHPHSGEANADIQRSEQIEAPVVRGITANQPPTSQAVKGGCLA